MWTCWFIEVKYHISLSVTQLQAPSEDVSTWRLFWSSVWSYFWSTWPRSQPRRWKNTSKYIEQMCLNLLLINVEIKKFWETSQKGDKIRKTQRGSQRFSQRFEVKPLEYYILVLIFFIWWRKRDTVWAGLGTLYNCKTFCFINKSLSAEFH